MEKNPINEASIDSIEKSANFEGNDGELVIERVSNPYIKSQIVELIYLQETELEKNIKETEWLPYLPDGSDKEDRFRLLKNTASDKMISVDLLNFVARTKEKIESDLDSAIDIVSRVTDISYSKEGPSSSCIPLRWKIPQTGELPTSKQMSIIEAHEKGHLIRGYDNLKSYFSAGFDISKVNITEEEYQMLKSYFESQDSLDPPNEPRNTSYESIKEEILSYLFTPLEIAERMSQLKNYFGMSGAEEFTREHLLHAKKNYVSDTKLDNHITYFLQAITPETEKEFIKLINTSGI